VFAAEDFPTMKDLVIWPDWFFEGTNFAVNKVTILSFLAMLIPVLLFVVAGSGYRRSLVPRGVQNLVEGTVEVVEKRVILPTMGAEGLSFLPLLLSMFLFIFVGNLFGIMPTVHFGANARMGNPVILAIISWLVFIGVGIKHHGPKYFLDAVNPPGVPLALKFLVVPIEIISVFLVRPFSLAIRLFANSLAGHILLVIFAVLTAQMINPGPSLIVAPLTFLGLVAFTGFELLVALLQAYVFTLLTAVYIAGAIHTH
jgi:F-type H+-transporting ATPase subunit a